MKNNILLGDSLLLMKNLKDRSVDHVITDIPYDVVSRESNGIRKFDKDVADVLEFDLDLFVKQITRIANDKILIFCASEQVSTLIKSLNKEGFPADLAIWKKTNPSPVNGQYIWLSGVECCVVASRNELSEDLKNVIWETSGGRSKNHPTEKPLKLLNLIIKNHTKKSDLILDPCAGSGSTLESALLNNRFFIGIEKHKEYYDFIIKRINNCG